MIISAIVAVSRNKAIGRDNQIPWYLPADLKYFKRTTMGHHVIMGRKTFESIGRPLPKRTNIVVTSNPYYTANNILVAHSLEEALELAYEQGETEVFIIGGGALYSESAELWDKLYLTEIDIDIPDATVFFPEIDMRNWEQVSKQCYQPDDKNEWGYCFIQLERKQNEE